jgi:uncharacterized protein (TIGR03083 family)
MVTPTSTRLTPERYLDALNADAERLVAIPAADPGVLDSAVPTCPGWTVADAVRHTAEVYLNKVECMRLGREPDVWPPELPGDDPVGAFRVGLEELLTELQTRGPEAPSYTWFPDEQTVGFWYRRMAQETAVHRFDVESAIGDIGPVVDDLAVDGIDEVLRVFLGYDMTGVPAEAWGDVDPRAEVGRTMLVRCGAESWRLTLTPARVEVASSPAAADVTVTGEPSELLLWLWGRRPDTAVRVEGDASVLAAVRGRLHLATQ